MAPKHVVTCVGGHACDGRSLEATMARTGSVVIRTDRPNARGHETGTKKVPVTSRRIYSSQGLPFKLLVRGSVLHFSRLLLSLMAGFTVLVTAVACGSDINSAPPASVEIESEQATVIISPTTIIFEPTESPTPTPPAAGTLTDAQKILDLALVKFSAADSYSADLIFDYLNKGDVKTRLLSLQVASRERFIGTDIRDSVEVELLHIDGATYERLASAPQQSWHYVGRELPEAMQKLQGSISFIQDPELLSTEVIKGVSVYKIRGSYGIVVSGPPASQGSEHRRSDSATMLIDTETMLPVFVSTDFRRDRVEIATGAATPVLMWSTSITFHDYGVEPEIAVPANVAPTPPTSPNRATPTPITGPGA